MVECGGLENRFGGFSSDEGSNPSPSVFSAVPTELQAVLTGGAPAIGPWRQVALRSETS